jgi:hypothetical protein
MIIDKVMRDALLGLTKKKVYLEGNILKVIKPESGDPEFDQYLQDCKKRDVDSRKKRLEVTKQVQSQNTELIAAQKENERVNKQLTKALDEAKASKDEAEKLRDEAVDDLDALQKRTQFELMSQIVKVALYVIVGVGALTTALYVFVLSMGMDAKIVESTWSNLFGILLTNSFSIIGTIMGVKYANEKN